MVNCKHCWWPIKRARALETLRTVPDPSRVLQVEVSRDTLELAGLLTLARLANPMTLNWMRRLNEK